MEIETVPWYEGGSKWQIHLLEVDGVCRPARDLKHFKVKKRWKRDVEQLEVIASRVAEREDYQLNEALFKSERDGVYAMRTDKIRAYCFKDEVRRIIVLATIRKKPKKNQQSKDISEAVELLKKYENQQR